MQDTCQAVSTWRTRWRGHKRSTEEWRVNACHRALPAQRCFDGCSRFIGPRHRDQTKTAMVPFAGPMVRIHLPPAASLMRT